MLWQCESYCNNGSLLGIKEEKTDILQNGENIDWANFKLGLVYRELSEMTKHLCEQERKQWKKNTRKKKMGYENRNKGEG